LSVVVEISNDPFLLLIVRLWGYMDAALVVALIVKRDRQLMASRREDPVVDDIDTGLRSGHRYRKSAVKGEVVKVKLGGSEDEDYGTASALGLL